ncbi:MAG: hypothetical protein IJT53_02920 [Prevotella sp.]|nr:hypothetical protein [Prevotella sp.]
MSENRIYGIRTLHITWVFLMMAVWCMGMVSCGQDSRARELAANKADSILFDIGSAKDYDRMRELADSFEMSGDLSALNANRWRGVSYYREGNYRMAEICYRKALECEVKNDQDQLSYNKSARRLSELLLVKGDFEGSLRIAIPAVEKMEKSGVGSDIDYAILLNNIGCCQLNLGQDDEANESFLTARGHYANRWRTDSTGRGFQEAVVGTVYTSMAYINTRRYAESIYWIDRTEMLLGKYRQKPDARSEYFDEYQGRIEIMRAVALQGLGKSDDAAKAYQAFLQTDYSKTGPGHINATDYLMAADRYKEAADNFRYLDRTLDEWGMERSLDNIQLYMLPKFNANRKAARGDSARVAAEDILNILDSAITAQKNSSTAELATIYDTNQKDAQIMQQRNEMTYMRWMSTLAALALLTIFFIVYTLHRRKAQKKLSVAYDKLEVTNEKLEESNRKLEEGNAKLSALNTQLSTLNSQLVTANARAEESSQMKTNFIQQISHEIRTPLNILSGFTQIITTPGMELDDETRADINRQINENTGRITNLVNKMLELSDASSQSVIERKDDVLAIQIAAQAAEDSHVNEAAHLTFDLQIAPEAEMTSLHTNESQATRALVLLLDNAIKFTRPAEAAMGAGAQARQGRVVLRVEQAEEPRRQLLFIVEDNGIGVPVEEAERIFEEFVQLDDYYDGTGIGLTVARSIVRRMGGDITLDTSYSPGARFIMTLPLN